MIRFRIPEIVRPDQAGRVWLRAGIRTHSNTIPEILQVYQHVVKLEPDPQNSTVILKKDREPLTGEWIEGSKLPGISSFFPVTPLYGPCPEESPEGVRLRTAEFVTHRDRAVTIRDYERMTLQHFREVGKVKCIPCFNGIHSEPGTLSLVVLPDIRDYHTDPVMPLVSSSLLTQIRDFFRGHISACVKSIRVIHPVYTPLVVQCRLRFQSGQPEVSAKEEILRIINYWIAPWQEQKVLPEWGVVLSLKDLYTQIEQQRFVKEVAFLSVIRMEGSPGQYKLYEYKSRNGRISPRQPHQLFIPAADHLLLTEEDPAFGIDKMVIGQTFIVDTYGTKKQTDIEEKF